MEDRFIRRQVLPIDDAARKRVRDLVNAYAAQGEGHPYEDYGDHITLQKYELCPIYTVSLRTQYDSRSISTRQYPYKGGNIYTRRFFKTSDVDVWSYKLLTTNEFRKDEKSYEVPGSHHVETCNRCGGSGKVICPDCGGTGTERCSVCHGNGQIQKTRSEYQHTADKVYSDGHREPVYSYVNVTYYETCRNCGGDGEVNCSTCNGDTRVTCPICHGYGRNVHCYAIDQKIYNVYAEEYLVDNRVAAVRELIEQKEKCRGRGLFYDREEQIQKGEFAEDREIASTLDGYIGKHALPVGGGCHILFQEADIDRIDVWWVQYTYQGKTYSGCISSGLGEERFFPETSPITDLAEKWMKEANKKIGGVGTVKARKLLEQVEKLNVYGIDNNVYGLESRVGRHLNIMYNLGNDLMFWLIALVGTPFIYNFYSELNPVLRYAHFINDPNWAPFKWVPAVQCILFLGLLWFAKFAVNEDDHSQERHATVFGYVFKGMALYVLIATIILVVMLGLNYLGLSAITTRVFWLGGQVLKILFIILFYAIMLAIVFVKWAWKLVLKLWHLIF
ncbi:MAG: hypothetical protein J6X57_08740 [Bacteroidales bacterium]|nr:hypothetical protein [Bacteroidales bacterium]